MKARHHEDRDINEMAKIINDSDRVVFKNANPNSLEDGTNQFQGQEF